MRTFAWLTRMEWRELVASRAYWLLLLLIGPLVGQAFVTAVRAYAEASGIGGPAALAQGLSPLDGIVVPTFGAYDLGVTFLFPFVAIRLVSGERQSGALKLALQAPAGAAQAMGAKLLVLLGAWLVAWLPGVLALVLWRAYGGHLHAPEVLTVGLGHVLRALLTAGIALAAAAVTDNAASAAIVTLGFTVGSWALDFVAAVRGGWLQALARFTPAATLHTFEQGLLSARLVIAQVLVGAGGAVFAAVWLRLGASMRHRVAVSLAVAAIVLAGAGLASLVRADWDLSEDRRSSFARADETALSQVPRPLGIRVHLAPEDPRLADYERGVVAKLRRVVPRLAVSYVSRSSTGLFEAAGSHYGEIWYELGDRRAMNRSTTAPIVLEEIYALAGMPVPARSSEPAYGGYPLAARPVGAAWLFYAAWPAAVVGAGWFIRFREQVRWTRAFAS